MKKYVFLFIAMPSDLISGVESDGVGNKIIEFENLLAAERHVAQYNKQFFRRFTCQLLGEAII